MDYATQEAVFDVPNGFLDVTLNRLVYRRPSGDLNVVITRTPAQGKSLTEAVDARLKDQERNIPYFEVVARSDRQIGNQPAIDVAATYQQAERRMFQRNVSIVVGKNVAVVAVLGPTESREEVDRIFEGAARSLVLRARGS